VACVTELSGCDYCAEVEIRRTEGRVRVPGDRDHQFQAIVITDSRGA
jgi:hypothetical protein